MNASMLAQPMIMVLLATALSSLAATMAFQSGKFIPFSSFLASSRVVIYTGSNDDRKRRTKSSELSMVFDFFKKASDEASDQFSAFTTGLAKSRNQFLYSLEDSLQNIGNSNTNSQSFLDQLEDTLLQADLGLATTEDVLKEARFIRQESTEIFTREDVKALLRGKLLEALGAAVSKQAERNQGAHGDTQGDLQDEINPFALRFATPLPTDDPTADPTTNPAADPMKKLTVLFIMGANGMGKTTTIGKLSHRLKTEANQKVLLAACDTFRAGAVSQLEQWADRAEVDCFSPNERTNGPSAVLYGALDKAINENYDVLLVDTSGRLSNNDALTAELVKMKRVIQKRMSVETDGDKPLPNLEMPHETLLVIDAAQGRMALDSAKQWHKELGLTGLILTKLDGSAKGGSVVAVSRELGLPVKLIGVGEGIDDLRDFDPESFVDGLLGIGIAGGGTSKDEGKELASRLKQMRNERNKRASTTSKSNVKLGGLPRGIPGMGGGPAGQLTFQGIDDDVENEEIYEGDMQLITPGANGSRRNSSSSSKRKKSNNKKKKKKKNKR